jgi:hypothetical protein
LRYIALAACLSAAVSSSAAAEWISVGKDATGSVWMMDGARLSVEGGRVHAWVKIDASRDRTVTFKEGLRLFSSICSSRKIMALSAIDYDSYGKVVRSRSYPDSTYSDAGYDYVTPDSMGETVLDISCTATSNKSQ